MIKKILFFTGGSYVAGLEIVTLQLIKGLKDRGFDVRCVVNGWNDGDFNYSQFVEFNDLLLLAQNYGASALNSGERALVGEAFASDWELARSLVPEPTILLAAPVSLLCSGRRRPTIVALF